MCCTKPPQTIPFKQVTQYQVYCELIRSTYIDHHSKHKWENRFPNCDISWDDVWLFVNNPLSREDTKTAIWEQLHLNDYTTYSYNKWHKAQQVCPLCLQLPNNKFHITLECPVTISLWHELTHHLLKIHPEPISEEEMVFGLSGSKPGIKLRNWLTSLLREYIVRQESIAYHNKKGRQNEVDIKLSYNAAVKAEVWEKYNILQHLGRTEYFKKMYAINNYLITWVDEQWQILTLYST